MVLLYDPLLIDNGAIVADAFQCHQVTLGDVGGIEPYAGMSFIVSFHLRIPIERCAMVWTRPGRGVRVLWRIELSGRFPTLLVDGGHGERAEGSAIQSRFLPDKQ